MQPYRAHFKILSHLSEATLLLTTDIFAQHNQKVKLGR